MNRASGKFIFPFLVLLPVAGILIHYFYLHPALIHAYEGRPDCFISFLINSLYPRFGVEKNRFDLSFFIQKSDQVLYRAILVYYIFALGRYFFIKKDSVQKKTTAFFSTPTSSGNIDVLRCLFFSYLLFLSFELCHDLVVMQPMKAFYKPILWLRLFHIPFPGYYAVIFIGALWYLINFLVLLNIRAVLFSSLSLILFLLVQCWVFSFEKLDHGYATYTYAFILLPFLLDEQERNTGTFNSWSLQLIRICLALVYFLSALEKIFISGFSWLEADTLKGYLYLHETVLSKTITSYDSLCVLISVATLVFQLSFVLILFLPRYKWIWIAGGILFHMGTLAVMGIGHPLNPWLLVYIFFFDWTKIHAFFLKRFKKGTLSSN